MKLQFLAGISATLFKKNSNWHNKLDNNSTSYNMYYTKHDEKPKTSYNLDLRNYYQNILTIQPLYSCYISAGNLAGMILPYTNYTWNMIRKNYFNQFLNSLKIDYLIQKIRFMGNQAKQTFGKNMTYYYNYYTGNSIPDNVDDDITGLVKPDQFKNFGPNQFVPNGNFTPCYNNSKSDCPTAFIPDFILSGDYDKLPTITYKPTNGNIIKLPLKQFNNDPSVYFINFSALKAYTDETPGTLSSDYQIFISSTILNKKIDKITTANKVYIQNPKRVYNLWTMRTGIVYSKMNNVWKSIISTQAYTKNKQTFTSLELAKAISAQTKLQNIKYAIITGEDKFMPYNTGIKFPYRINNIVSKLNSPNEKIASSFLHCITGDVKELFKF